MGAVFVVVGSGTCGMLHCVELGGKRCMLVGCEGLWRWGGRVVFYLSTVLCWLVTVAPWVV